MARQARRAMTAKDLVGEVLVRVVVELQVCPKTLQGAIATEVLDAEGVGPKAARQKGRATANVDLASGQRLGGPGNRRTPGRRPPAPLKDTGVLSLMMGRPDMALHADAFSRHEVAQVVLPIRALALVAGTATLIIGAAQGLGARPRARHIGLPAISATATGFT